MVNKRVQNAVLGCNLKNDRMTSVHFQGKPFNITVIQAYAPTSNAEEAGPITSWQIDGETMEIVTDYFFGLQNHC